METNKETFDKKLFFEELEDFLKEEVKKSCSKKRLSKEIIEFLKQKDFLKGEREEEQIKELTHFLEKKSICKEIYNLFNNEFLTRDSREISYTKFSAGVKFLKQYGYLEDVYYYGSDMRGSDGDKGESLALTNKGKLFKNKLNENPFSTKTFLDNCFKDTDNCFTK